MGKVMLARRPLAEDESDYTKVRYFRDRKGKAKKVEIRDHPLHQPYKRKKLRLKDEDYDDGS